MKTIILPGYSEHNRDWAHDIKNEMNLADVVVHEWRHWPPAQRASGPERQRGSFNLDYEVGEIVKKIGEDKVNIIAKSVGTSVAMHLLKAIPKQIEKLILCGIPINGFGGLRLDLFKEGLSHFPIDNLIIFQNEKDNLGSWQKVADFVSSINPKIGVVKMPRSDHHYPYPAEFKKFLLS